MRLKFPEERRNGMFFLDENNKVVHFKWVLTGGSIMLQGGKILLQESLPQVHTENFDRLFRCSMVLLRQLVENCNKSEKMQAWDMITDAFRKWEVDVLLNSNNYIKNDEEEEEENNNNIIVVGDSKEYLNLKPRKLRISALDIVPHRDLRPEKVSCFHHDELAYARGKAVVGCKAVMIVRKLSRVPLIAQILWHHTSFMYLNPDGETWTSSYYDDGRVREDSPKHRPKYRLFEEDDGSDEDVALFRYNSCFDGVLLQTAECIVEKLYDVHRFPSTNIHTYHIFGRNCHDYCRDVCKVYESLEKGLPLPQEFAIADSSLETITANSNDNYILL